MCQIKFLKVFAVTERTLGKQIVTLVLFLVATTILMFLLTLKGGISKIYFTALNKEVFTFNEYSHYQIVTEEGFILENSSYSSPKEQVDFEKMFRSIKPGRIYEALVADYGFFTSNNKKLLYAKDISSHR